MPDEAHFELSGCVNKQNRRYWSEANPNELHLQPLHSQRITVLSGISAFGINGPYFYLFSSFPWTRLLWPLSCMCIRWTSFCCQSNAVVTSTLLPSGLSNTEQQNIQIGSRRSP